MDASTPTSDSYNIAGLVGELSPRVYNQGNALRNSIIWKLEIQVIKRCTWLIVG